MRNLSGAVGSAGCVSHECRFSGLDPKLICVVKVLGAAVGRISVSRSTRPSPLSLH